MNERTPASNLEFALNTAFMINAYDGFDPAEFDEVAYEIRKVSGMFFDPVDVLELEGGSCLEMLGERDSEPENDDSMDGDEASALASIGWGTDEDYVGWDGSEN